MNFGSDDSERELFFETARLAAQREFEADNTNAQALIRWAGALLELAHYKQGDESVSLIEQAIGKCQQALSIDPDRHEAEWIQGNGFTSLGFLSPDKSKAQLNFDKASQCFQRCKNKDPANETYKKAIEMCDKAPEYYDEIQSHIQTEAAARGMGDSGRGKDAPDDSAFWWDIAGWVVLGAIVVGGLAFARGPAPPPPATK